MKHKLFFAFLCASMCMNFSCTSDDDMRVDNPTSNDSIEVCFNLTGDFLETSEKPLKSKGTVTNPKTYYHIIIDGDKNNTTSTYHGNIGFFSDLKYARIRLERGSSHTIQAAALIEKDFPIDTKSLSELVYINSMGYVSDSVNVYNQFSQDLFSGGMNRWHGQVQTPEFTDQGLDRYYNEKIVTVNSNETISIDLKRLSYKLNFEVDAPSEGSIELSCESPNFKYRINTNDSKFIKSNLYSFGGTEISNVSRKISLKLEHFDSNGTSKSSTTRDVTIKPNVETNVKINFDKSNANNSFNLTLDTTPMKQEEFIWE